MPPEQDSWLKLALARREQEDGEPEDSGARFNSCI